MNIKNHSFIFTILYIVVRFPISILSFLFDHQGHIFPSTYIYVYLFICILFSYIGYSYKNICFLPKNRTSCTKLIRGQNSL